MRRSCDRVPIFLTLPFRSHRYGVAPVYARARGNTTVTVFGSFLGNGSDIIQVYLSRVAVTTILNQSSTHVVVVSSPMPSSFVQSFSVLTVSSLFGNGTSRSGSFHYAVPNSMRSLSLQLGFNVLISWQYNGCDSITGACSG